MDIELYCCLWIDQKDDQNLNKWSCHFLNNLFPRPNLLLFWVDHERSLTNFLSRPNLLFHLSLFSLSLSSPETKIQTNQHSDCCCCSWDWTVVKWNSCCRLAVVAAVVAVVAAACPSRSLGPTPVTTGANSHTMSIQKRLVKNKTVPHWM